MLRTKALLERETLDEGDILEVTGFPPAPPLENRKVPDEGPSCSPAARAGARNLQYIPFVEGLPLPQSLGTQHGEATSYSVRYPRYDQRPARGAR